MNYIYYINDKFLVCDNVLWLFGDSYSQEILAEVFRSAVS